MSGLGQAMRRTILPIFMLAPVRSSISRSVPSLNWASMIFLLLTNSQYHILQNLQITKTKCARRLPSLNRRARRERLSVPASSRVKGEQKPDYPLLPPVTGETAAPMPCDAAPPSAEIIPAVWACFETSKATMATVKSAVKIATISPEP